MRMSTSLNLDQAKHLVWPDLGASCLQNLSAKAGMPTILILQNHTVFQVDFHITISNVKIMANNNFKMVPDKITRVTPFSTIVIPDHW